MNSVNLKNYEKQFDDLRVGTLWVEYGINGLLPRVQLDINAVKGAINNGYEDELVVVIEDKQIISSPILINNTLLDVKTSSSIMTGLLVPDSDFVFGTGTNSFNSTNDVINKLWNGTIPNVPNYDNVNLNQLGKSNHKYLTEILMSLSYNSGFYYGLNNDIKIFDLDNMIDYDFDENNENIKAKNNSISINLNNYFKVNEESSDITDLIGNVNNGDIIRFYDRNHKILSENLAHNTLCLNKSLATVSIDFNNLNITPGTVIAFRFNNQKVIAMVVSIKIYLSSLFKMSANCIVLNLE